MVGGLKSIDLPCSPVNTLDDLFTDEHLAAVDFFETVEHPSEGRIVLPRHPVRYDSEDIADLPTPRLGDNTDEVLGEAGYSVTEIASLRSEGALG